MFTKRRGYTLVEIMVVIAIMAALTGMVLLFLPSRQSTIASQSADTIQTMLASARSRALRDQVQVGVRFLSNDNGATFTQAVFVEQAGATSPYTPYAVNPAVYANFPNPTPSQVNNSNQHYTMQLVLVAANGQVTPYPFNVGTSDISVGDYFENVETPADTPRRVIAIDPAAGEITLETVPNCAKVTGSRQWKNYRFLRTSVSYLMGDKVTQLPVNAVLLGNGITAPSSLHLPQDNNGNYQIMFSPSGQVMNMGSGRIVLWFSDTIGKAKPALLCVYTRTGAVSSHPVGPVGREYQYTQDGRSSGQ